MQQRGGGSQYGASPTEMTPFASAATDTGHSMLGGSSDHPQQQQQQQLKLGDPSLAEAEAEAEAASPISSRPPATTAHSSAANFEEPLPVPIPIPGGLPDEDMLGGEEVDRVGVAVGNRWPRQETLALLKIRSDMDATFRDATSLKGPLWEDVSRKLADLGYKRSAKKCKEKFENVHKYYKRTKEGRAGRQDGKSYRFFSQLEALAGSNVSAATSTMPTSTKPTLTCVASSQQLVAAPLPVSIGIGIGIEVTNPMHAVSSISIPPPLVSAALPQAPAPSAIGAIFPSDLSAGIAPPSSGPAAVAARPAAAAIGVCFTSDSSASSAGSEELEEDEEMEAAAAAIEGDLEGEQAGTSQRKRQRGSSKRVSSSGSQRMMEFFEGLMKQVMQKQEGMQQRFLETIEKREQDRMIREEAWKRQEMARLAREHELMAQERAMSASRDAAIIAFLQKITGQTVQLPQSVIIPAAPPPPPPTFPIPPSSSVPPPPPPPPPPSEQRHHKTQQQQWQHYEQQPHHQQQHHHHPQAAVELVKHHHPTISSEVVMAVPEQQVRPQEIRGGASFETSSSRWPKAEVLALINLRSGLESRYQEAGPKGPLWEEISAGMQRMGYKRSAKRCKEKWENINKYFKKVKESNKKRPADAKTCPYFHQLDALYRKKIIGSSSGGGGSSVDGNQNRPEQQQQESGMMDPIPAISLQEMTDVPTIMPSSQTTELDNKGGVSSDLQTSNAGLTATLFGEGSCGGADTGAKEPEDIVKEQQQKQQTQQLLMMDCDKTDEPDNDIIDQDDEEDDEDDDDDGDGDGDGDDDDDDDQVEMNKMAYKIEFQRQNAGSSNGGGNGAPSFLAMVQ